MGQKRTRVRDLVDLLNTIDADLEVLVYDAGSAVNPVISVVPKRKGDPMPACVLIQASVEER
jgi:hypothetical protein